MMVFVDVPAQVLMEVQICRTVELRGGQVFLLLFLGGESRRVLAQFGPGAGRSTQVPVLRRPLLDHRRHNAVVSPGGDV